MTPSVHLARETRHLLLFATIAVAAQPANAQTARQVHYYNPVWSTDGRSLAFESDRDSGFAVYVVNVDGTRLRKLTPDGVVDEQPGWSPDGRSLVVTSNQGGAGRLWMTDATAASRRHLTSSPERSYFFASFSPNGQSIVMGAQDARHRDRYYVVVMAADGTGRRELTDSTYVSEGARWTADGARIAFTRYARLPRDPGESPRDHMTRLRRATETISMRPDGSDVRVGPAADADLRRVHDPALSPDSQWLAKGKTVGGVPGIYVREVATGRERLVVGGRPH